MIREPSTDETADGSSDDRVVAGKQPWDKPKVHRLRIEETASSPGSGGDPGTCGESALMAGQCNVRAGTLRQRATERS